MCASATSIIHWMAVPVFADIDYETYNITADTIKKITKFTKAQLFQIYRKPAEIDKIMRLARKKN